MKIEELKPFEKNPKKHTPEQILKIDESIREFGWRQPIIHDKDGEIIIGHGRYFAYIEHGKKMELKEPWIVSADDLTKEQVTKLRLIDNKLNESDWNLDILKEYGEDFLKDIGFPKDDLDEIFGLDMTDDFDVEAEKEKLLKGDPLRTAAGQIWKLGNHKLIIGDATIRENWEKLFGQERFELMFTDPPYRLAYSRKRVRKVKTKDGFKIKHEREYIETGSTNKEGEFTFGMAGNRSYQGVEMKRGVPLLDEWLSIAKDFQQEKGASVMIFENWKNLRELWDAIEEYWKIMNLIIWHLPNRMQGFSRPHSFYNKFDIAILGEQGEASYSWEEEQELEKYLTEKGAKIVESYDVILYGHDPKDKTREFTETAKRKWGRLTDHISWTGGSEKSTGQGLVFGTKPLQILVPYMKALSTRESIVAEPFGGSGSTLIAAEIMKRRCYVIELSPLYAEVILRRWEKFTGQKAEMIPN